MILKETILSLFTEKATLLKWLKKVEKALNNAVLTDISVEQISATQVKLKFTFENGDFVESPILTLPRGEKGEPGKDGLDGTGIAATVEVGTVTTGAAGTNASVTNVGTEQRAILNFVIPRGDRGLQGAQGQAGVGIDSASEMSINDGEINIIAGDNGVNIDASFEVAVGEETLIIPSTMYLPFKGSESIVIDVDESGQFIDIHLDAEIVTKLSRVLLTPMTAPTSISLVAVDTTNSQTMLELGDGFVVENGKLKTTGGITVPLLYKHKLKITDAEGTNSYFLLYINGVSNAITNASSLSVVLNSTIIGYSVGASWQITNSSRLNFTTSSSFGYLQYYVVNLLVSGEAKPVVYKYGGNDATFTDEVSESNLINALMGV